MNPQLMKTRRPKMNVLEEIYRGVDFIFCYDKENRPHKLKINKVVLAIEEDINKNFPKYKILADNKILFIEKSYLEKV
jgi:hypothetical protein